MDIRSQRTKQVISESFLELLKEKPASRITVTEICSMASINRATFYKHYLDVPDLQESLENEILSDFASFLHSCGFADNVKYKTVLIKMLTYLQQYGSRFFLLCSGNAGSELPAKAFKLINDFVFPIMRQKLPTEEEGEAKLLYQFLTHGCGALLVSWHRGEGNLSVEEIAEFIMRISGAAVQSVSGLGDVRVL